MEEEESENELEESRKKGSFSGKGKQPSFEKDTVDQKEAPIQANKTEEVIQGFTLPLVPDCQKTEWY